MNKFLEVYGPLIFWSLMFLIGTFIKVFAFNDSSFWIQIPQEISLWATGVLFTLSTSEKTYYNARLTPKYAKNAAGFQVDYEITLDDEFGFKPKFIYLFLIGATIWIINLILSNVLTEMMASTTSTTLKLVFAIVIPYLLSVFITIIALYSTYEISR